MALIDTKKKHLSLFLGLQTDLDLIDWYAFAITLQFNLCKSFELFAVNQFIELI